MATTRKEFVKYLRTTLIPDLLESGRHFTAADFEVACQFIEDPKLKSATHPTYEEENDGYPSDLSLQEKGE